MRVTIPVKCPDGRVELSDTKLMETSVMLKIATVAEKPKVFKIKKIELSLYLYYLIVLKMDQWKMQLECFRWHSYPGS